MEGGSNFCNANNLSGSHVDYPVMVVGFLQLMGACISALSGISPSAAWYRWEVAMTRSG